MKKLYAIAVFALSAALALGSCAGEKPDSKQQAIINEVVKDATAITLPTDTTSAAAPEASLSPAGSTSAAPTGDTAQDTGVDIDLTVMNPTMIYATVYDIVTAPEQYLGKTIRVSGYFDTGYDESLDTRYYFVVIPDATACCLQGLEFKADGRVYPDDYPEVRTDIQISGTLDKYVEQGHDYYYIASDSMVVV